MDEEDQALCRELSLVDTDLGFLFFIVLAVLLSFWATARQRDAVYLTLQGEAEEAARVGEVTGLRMGAAALVAGSLGFFFMQALESCQQADPADETARRSAKNDLTASFLVLLAALIRLFDLNMVRRAQPSLDNTLPPS